MKDSPHLCPIMGQPQNKCECPGIPARGAAITYSNDGIQWVDGQTVRTAPRSHGYAAELMYVS